MAFSEKLVIRVRDVIARKKGIVEKRMFGGVVFLLNGHILVAVWKDSLIVRLGSEESDKALREPYVREFDITGRPMKGWVMVEPTGVEDEDQLTGWIHRGRKFVARLPAK